MNKRKNSFKRLTMEILMKYTRLTQTTLLLGMGLLLGSCSSMGVHKAHEMGDKQVIHHEKMVMKNHDSHKEACCDENMPVFTQAVAVLSPTAGHTARGIVTFTQTDSGVRVVAELENVPPGKHGFHVHEFGNISAPDGTSAGGHFNPTGMSHGGPMAGERHGGDMGNVIADEKGIAQLDYVDAHIKLNGPESIIGRGVILHADEDDLKSQPTGAAGARIASGVIGVAGVE